MSTLDLIGQEKIIAIVRKVYGEDLIHLAEALYRGGIRLLECTFDQQDRDCLDKTTDAVASLDNHFHGEMQFGAGTVLTAQQVESARSAGAKFIVSPNVDEDVIQKTKELGLVSIPGAMTPTEILTAHKLGADVVKLFPATSLGFSYIRDILAPISHVKLLATGGVNEENLAGYLRMGFIGAGISGRLADKKLIAAGDWEEISRRANVLTGIAANP